MKCSFFIEISNWPAGLRVQTHLLYISYISHDCLVIYLYLVEYNSLYVYTIQYLYLPFIAIKWYVMCEKFSQIALEREGVKFLVLANLANICEGNSRESIYFSFESQDKILIFLSLIDNNIYYSVLHWFFLIFYFLKHFCRPKLHLSARLTM